MKSQEYHRHSDVYAFGISLLQMLTGKSSVSWLVAGRNVVITDFCDVDEEDAMTIADPQAGWPQEIAQTVLTLGKQSTLFMSQCPYWFCRARVHCKWQAPHCSKSSQDGHNHRTHCCHGGTSTSVTTCSSRKGVHGDYSCTFTSYSPSDDSDGSGLPGGDQRAQPLLSMPPCCMLSGLCCNDSCPWRWLHHMPHQHRRCGTR